MFDLKKPFAVWGAIALMFLMQFAGFYLLHKNFPSLNETRVFISVDFEQGFFDSKTEGVNVSAGEWMSSIVESICAKSDCIIFQGGTILGGDVVDVNQMFRDEFGIENPAEKVSVSNAEFIEFIRLFEDK